jgi:hypothetical protein
MTIKQLIQELSKFNPDQQIRFSSYLESEFGSWTGCSDLKGPFIEQDEDVVEIRFEGEEWIGVEEFDEDED